MQFSDITNNNGIAEQARYMTRVDANQWPVSRIVNSCNNWLDFVAGYAIGADRRFQWDDTNHTKLPIGSTNLVANQSDYSFLSDEQGNTILNLTGIEVQDSTGVWRKLDRRDWSDSNIAEDEILRNAALPTEYDLIADNTVRITPKPISSVTAGLKFYFQRTPSYFLATDTTKNPGVPPLIHRGFVIATACDIAMTLGLPSFNALSIERQREETKLREYFAHRNTDSLPVISAMAVDAM